ncbi:hypothetical protein [Microbacterium sp.]|uniref:hypothetical protein n=1 Tax=Microbacterium sp. TaxID=51671 RepID=UPI003A8FCCB5
MRVVVFSPADSFTENSLPELTADDVVVVVCWAADPPRGAERIGLRPRPFSDRVARAANVHVVLRTLLRLSPFDKGAVFWRAVRESAEVAEVAMRADLMVAPERDGAFAAWNALARARRQGRHPLAVSGYPAGRAAIERLR